MKKILVLLLISLLLVGCASSAKNNELPALTDGTYTSTTQGRGGDVVVETVITDGKIASVTVVEHNETPDISDPAIEDLPGLIVEEQSVAVDVISGATMTSEAILAAVSDAITQAGGNVDDYK